jgi:hypothetical protein
MGNLQWGGIPGAYSCECLLECRFRHLPPESPVTRDIKGEALGQLS